MKLVYAFIIICLFSCDTSNKKKLFNEIIDCVNNSLNENISKRNKFLGIKDESDIDIIFLTEMLENELYKMELLTNKHENGYTNLIDNIKNGNNLSLEIEILKESVPKYFNLNNNSSMNNLLFDICPVLIYEKNILNKKLFRVISIYDEIDENGYPLIHTISKFKNEIDFNDDYSRLTLCNMIMYHLFAINNGIKELNDMELEEKDGLFYKKTNTSN